jgi:hypothetical protein
MAGNYHNASSEPTLRSNEWRPSSIADPGTLAAEIVAMLETAGCNKIVASIKS